MTENETNKMDKSITCRSSTGNDVQISGNAQQKIRSMLCVKL